MQDDVILGKITNIERCLMRIQSTVEKHPNSEFETNFDIQDIILLNLQRACEASIDLAAHVVRKKKIGLPQANREVFELLQKAGLLQASTCRAMVRMTGFRNIAIHEYQQLDMKIVRAIIEKHLPDFQKFIKEILEIG